MSSLPVFDPQRLAAADFEGRKAKGVAHLKLQGGYGWLYQVEGLTRLQILDQTIKGKTTRTWLVDNMPYETRDQAIAAYNGDPMPEQPKQKYSITAQIAEVERELKMREKVYPNLVRKHDMRQAEADYHLACMRDGVLESLRWLAENRSAIAEWLKQRPAKKADAA